MRYRSTVAAAALFCVQSAFAFDASTINFEQQAYNYSSNYSFDALALNEAQTQQERQCASFNEAPAHRLPKYLSTAPEKDWDYLMGQTYTILGLSVATVGLMTLLPESVTNWTAERS